MSSPFSVSIDGTSLVIDNLNNFSNELEAEIQALLEQAGNSTFDDSQQVVPVLTGELKDSGHVIVEKLNVTVEYDSDHAIFPEVGTVNQQAQPYLYPSFEVRSQQLLNDLKTLAEG